MTRMRPLALILVLGSVLLVLGCSPNAKTTRAPREQTQRTIGDVVSEMKAHAAAADLAYFTSFCANSEETARHVMTVVDSTDMSDWGNHLTSNETTASLTYDEGMGWGFEANLTRGADGWDVASIYTFR